MTERLAAKMRSIFYNRIPVSKLSDELTDEVKEEFEKIVDREIEVAPISVKAGETEFLRCPTCNSAIESLPKCYSVPKYCSQCGRKFFWQQPFPTEESWYWMPQTHQSSVLFYEK